MYQALYRKYRPKTFSDVTGQAAVTETLTRELADGRLAHAYLFTGTRGTGKTTCAKLLAKAVNCERPVNGEPCNECATCRGIDDGSVLDVTEMDAASNNGVDDVRMLQEEAFYLPASAKKRVYIIDEVHMLSKSAFNALLKTLEEPPEHLLFILATTELYKVPATILSRCQKFTFRRIPRQLIAERLLHIAQLEQLPLTEDGAAILARLADGALRDALSLLERCQNEATINRETVVRVLGLAGAESIVRLFKLLYGGEVIAALELLNSLYIEGSDVGSTLEQLANYVRDSLILSMSGQGAEALLSGEFDAEELFSGDTSLLLSCAELLQTALKDIDRAPDRKTAAEIALLKIGIRNSEFGAVASAPIGVNIIRPSATPPPTTDNPSVGAGSTRPPETVSTNSEFRIPNSEFTWEQLMRKVKLNPLIMSELKKGRDVQATVSADAITLHITHPFLEEQLSLPESVSAFKDAAMELCGHDMKVVIMSGGRIPAAAPAKRETAVTAPPVRFEAEPPVGAGSTRPVEPPDDFASPEEGNEPPWNSLDDIAAKFSNLVQFTEE